MLSKEERLARHRDTQRRAILQAMRRAGVTNTQVAEACDVSVQAVGDWLRTGKISSEHLPVIADLCNTSVDELVGRATGVKENQVIYLKPQHLKLIPRYPWTLDFDLPNKNEQEIDQVIASGDFGPEAFALDVEGDAMQPDFSPGSTIYVDPDQAAEPGDYVVAIPAGASRPIFRRLQVESGEQLLTAANPRYPAVKAERIIGKVFASTRAL